MACCGGRRAVVAAAAPAAPVTFEYVGRASMRVVGAATQRNYWFAQSGARVAVDPRDAASLAAVPQVVRLSPAR